MIECVHLYRVGYYLLCHQGDVRDRGIERIIRLADDSGIGRRFSSYTKRLMIELKEDAI